MCVYVCNGKKRMQLIIVNIWFVCIDYFAIS